jgi:hypothetical protein
MSALGVQLTPFSAERVWAFASGRWSPCTKLNDAVVSRILLFAVEPCVLYGLPRRCQLNLTAVNHEGRGRRLSSRQVLAFRIALDSTEDTIYVEQWRSSDHDRITLRGRTGELDGVRGMWMSGDSDVQSGIGCFSLRAALETLDQHLEPGPLGGEAMRLQPRPEEIEYVVRPFRSEREQESHYRMRCVNQRESNHNCSHGVRMPSDLLGVFGQACLKSITVCNGVPTACVLAFCAFHCPRDVEYRVTCSVDDSCVLCSKAVDPGVGGRWCSCSVKTD